MEVANNVTADQIDDIVTLSKPSEFTKRRSLLGSACKGIEKLAIGFGYTKDQAKDLSNTKEEIFRDSTNYAEKLKIRDHIKLGILLPIGLAFTTSDWFKVPLKERKESLWAAGIDTEGFNYMEDVLCTTVDSGQFCGFCIYGQERTDDEWVNRLGEDGKKISSLEAQLANKDDPEYSRDIRELGGVT